MQLNNTVSAVVTGGASGLGEASVRALAAKGVKVAIFDIAEEKGEALAKELGAIFCKADVTSDKSVDAAFAKARAANGQERVLINCAGVGNIMKTVKRDRATGEIIPYPMSEFEKQVSLNLFGTFRCITKSAAGMFTLEPLEDGERGAIVNTGSVAAVEGQAGQVGYAAAKAGVVGSTLPVARDLMGDGIRVNTIMPGIMGTPPMLGAGEEFRAKLAAQVPFPKRLGHPAEFANLAICLVETTYINGESIRLDGAIRMGPK